MFEWFILLLVLFILYSIMKTPKTITKKPVPKTEAKIEKPSVSETTQAALKKPSAEQKVAKKPPTAVPKPTPPTPTISVAERVGLTAGSIWHYLAENGPTSVSKLVKELAEEEKIIQRSIGWLAQEDKITLDTVDRVETITLKE